MKQLSFLKSFFLLCALMVGNSVWAQDWSYTVQNGDWSGNTSKLNTTAKTFTVDANHVWSYADSEVGAGSPSVGGGTASSTYGLKFGSSGSAYFNPVILSTSAFSNYAVTKVSLKLKHNGKKVGNLTIKQGNVTIGTATSSNTSDWITISCSETNKGEGGTLEIKYEVAQALYINKIEVWYEDLGTTHTLSSAVNPLNSGSVSLGSTEIVENGSTTITATPISGYAFSNWTVSGTGASVTDPSAASTTFTMGTEDATVTANFTEVNYWVVTYDYNDGVTANENVQVLKADAASYTLKAAPSRESYNFIGWKIGETTYNAGAAYEPTGNVTATAQWEFNGTLITYNKSGKSDIATGAKYIMVGSNTANNVTTWKFATAMGSDTYLHAAGVGEHGTLDADKAELFDETPEIITLNETEEGWTMTNASDKKIGLTGDKKLGYDGGDTTWDLGGTEELPTFSATNSNKDYTMYFNWNNGNPRFNAYNTSAPGEAYFYRLDDGKDVYTLTLDFNYGSVADGTHRVLEGAAYTLTTPIRSGYAFTGWNTEEDGTGTNYLAGAYTMPAAATTLYAQWSSTVPATITAAEYATFSSAYATDFSTTGITVYTAEDKETSVALNEVDGGQVPANTPVVLYKAGADGTDINVHVIASASAISSTNDLHVVGEGGLTGVDNIFVLSKKNNKVGFRLWDKTQTLNAGKIYLQGQDSYGARDFLAFDGTTTGIANVEANDNLDANAPMYNLAGQRVTKSYKGVVIVNGKKMLNK